MTNDDLQYRTAQAAEDAALFEQAKRREKMQVASIRATVTASGGTLNLHFQNPGDSGLDANTARIVVATQFEGTFTVHDEFSSAPSGGTVVTIDNLLMDEAGGTDEGSMNANQDVTFTSSGTHLQGVLPSGGPGGSIGGQTEQTEPIIEPGREIVTEVTNTSGSDAEASITILYAEEDVADRPE